MKNDIKKRTAGTRVRDRPQKKSPKHMQTEQKPGKGLKNKSSKMHKKTPVTRKKGKTYITLLPYIAAGYLFNKMAQAYHLSEAKEAARRLLDSINLLGEAMRNPIPSFVISNLIIGVTGGLLLRLAVYLKSQKTKKFRHGIEYGSAQWGKHEDIIPFMDPDPRLNMILTQTEGLRTTKPEKATLGRNLNCMVIGGSGTGKTRFVVKPNLMQMYSSYIVTDPKGLVAVECGQMLKNHGYEIKIFNTANFAESMKYNPFEYLHTDQDILIFADTLIQNTTGEGEHSGDKFWTDAEKLLYMALIAYIKSECIEEEQNFATLLDLINLFEVREDDEDFKNVVDYLFEELEGYDPDHFAVRQYRKFKLSAGKTAKSILVSCGARLAPFDIKEMREITMYDELELDRLGDRKTALFVVISDTVGTFNFIVAVLYTQMFNLLCNKADYEYGGSLPVHVSCLFDEFANTGKIPDFEKKIATFRSRNISAMIILQSKAQLKSRYKDDAETIADNCDSTLFLGGKGDTTLKEMSELLGKETIDLFNTSDSRGTSNSYGVNYQKTGRELMTKDELAVMDGSKCILQLRGVRPFLSDKYDIMQHPRYKELMDADRKNRFDIKDYLDTRLKLKKSDVAEVYCFDDISG